MYFSPGKRKQVVKPSVESLAESGDEAGGGLVERLMRDYARQVGGRVAQLSVDQEDTDTDDDDETDE